MSFYVQAYADGHKLTVTTETAKEAFAEAVDWHVVGRFTNVAISDGFKDYSIAEFASLMALMEIENTVEAATGPPAHQEQRTPGTSPVPSVFKPQHLKLIWECPLSKFR